MTATVQRWTNPLKISVSEGVGGTYRTLADFWMPQVTEEEALANAQLFADAYNARHSDDREAVGGFMGFRMSPSPTQAYTQVQILTARYGFPAAIYLSDNDVPKFRAALLRGGFEELPSD